MWCPTLACAEKYFGEQTFNPTSTYFSREAAVLKLVFESSGAFVTRIAPVAVETDVVTVASVNAARLLECHVLLTDIPQYLTDADGARIADDDGEWQPLYDDEDPPALTGLIDGIELLWTWRTLDADETAEELSGTGTAPVGSTWGRYPMMVVYADNSPGVWGNDAGFSLYYDADHNSSALFDRLGSPLYSFAPVLRDENDVVGVVRDLFSSISNDFTFKENVIDPITDAAVSMDDVLEARYTDGRLPYAIKAWPENFKEIGDLLVAKEASAGAIAWQFADGATTATATYESGATLISIAAGVDGFTVGEAVAGDEIPDGAVIVSIAVDDDTITISEETTGAVGGTLTIDTPTNVQFEFEDGVDGYGINILTGVDPSSGNHYQRLVVTENATQLAALIAADADHDYVVASMLQDTNYYLTGGVDGTFDTDGEEAYITALLAGTLANPDGSYADLEDASHYPFNYLFDVGYSLALKKKLIAFTGTTRDDVRASVGAYIPGETNDAATNIDTGLTLRNYGILQRESVAMGTEGCRTSVWAQGGKLIADPTNRWYPTSVWDAYVHAKFMNRQSIQEVPEGLPNSAVTLFSELNWVPSSEAVKEVLWNSGLNYTQYYDMSRQHFPAIRTVYNNDTSVLTNNTFIDAVVFAKQAARARWHQYSGMATPFAQLSAAINRDVTADIQRIFNGRYEFDVTVYQTAEDQRLGFVARILLNVTSPGTNRVWAVHFVANREGYEG